MRSRQIRQKFLPSKVRLPALVWLVTPFLIINLITAKFFVWISLSSAVQSPWLLYSIIFSLHSLILRLPVKLSGYKCDVV